MWNRLAFLAVVSMASQAQTQPGSLRVDLPPDAPLALVSADWGASRVTARGGALLLELHSTLQLKNTGARRIRAVSLLVTAQDRTPGGRASVTLPSLDIETSASPEAFAAEMKAETAAWAQVIQTAGIKAD